MIKAFTVILTTCGVYSIPEGTDESWIEALGAFFNRALRATVGARAEDELKTIELGCGAEPGLVASRATGEKACAIVVSPNCDDEFLWQIHYSPILKEDPVPILRFRLVPCTDGVGGEAQALICEKLEGFSGGLPQWNCCQSA